MKFALVWRITGGSGWDWLVAAATVTVWGAVLHGGSGRLAWVGFGHRLSVVNDRVISSTDD